MVEMSDSSVPRHAVPRVALVTGAAKRIGRAIACDLAAQGWDIALHHHRSADEAERAAQEIRALGRRAVTLAADLADSAEAAKLIGRAAGALGAIGCLVNNASVFEYDTPQTATRENWEMHLAVNLTTPFFLIQAFSAALPREAGGVVVNLLDQRVWNPTPHFASYTVSKIGLWALTQTCALALAPRIRVNAIGPGPTLPSARQSEAQFREQWRNMPLGRPTGLDEISAALRFILATPSMTGQMIALDGGQHLGWRWEGATLAGRKTPE